MLHSAYKASAPVQHGRKISGLLPKILLGLTGVCGWFAAPALAQEAVTAGNTRPLIDQYISDSWTTLTRSTGDCRSYVDPKVTGVVSLYIPAELPISPELRELEQRCHIKIHALPMRISKLGDLPVSDLAENGLLYLPRPYVTPGGRFNEMYGWDSYFIELGLLESRRFDLAKDMIENFDFEAEHYGGVLTANRTYYLSRSQPPLLASMILEYYNSVHQHQPDHAPNVTWLRAAYGSAEKAYALWTRPERRAGETGLAHYGDFAEGPVPEMSDADTYYQDVIRWFEAHPAEANGALVKQVSSGSGPQNAWSCDPKQSRVCEHAQLGDVGLSRDFYQGDRADRESGFDTTFRFGPYARNTHHIAPVCLNSLLYRYEEDMAAMATMLGNGAEASKWRTRAASRKTAINKYLWNAKDGSYFDYDFVAARQTHYTYASMFYPLWAGLASRDQASKVQKQLHLLEQPFGLAMSTTDTGLQWDFPFGWAPCNWIAVQALLRSGYRTDALRLAGKFVHLVQSDYQVEGTIREKYDVVNGGEVHVRTGYSANVIGFGWTNGVYLSLQSLLAATR